MCNASFKEGVLPLLQTHAIVNPRLKKTTLNPEDLNAFRPISNLSFLSKTIERVVAVRFNEHVEANKLLLKYQSAYRANHSTETAVTAIHNDIIPSVDRKDHVSVLVLLDLSAAFDTVDHAILLSVLECRFGLSGIELQWHRSDLEERSQTFQMGTVYITGVQCRLQCSSGFSAYCAEIHHVYR